MVNYLQIEKTEILILKLSSYFIMDVLSLVVCFRSTSNVGEAGPRQWHDLSLTPHKFLPISVVETWYEIGICECS